jgi:hypothetical protein
MKRGLQGLAHGSKEVWITPVSAWLQTVKEAKGGEQDLLQALRSVRAVLALRTPPPGG